MVVCVCVCVWGGGPPHCKRAPPTPTLSTHKHTPLNTGKDHPFPPKNLFTGKDCKANKVRVSSQQFSDISPLKSTCLAFKINRIFRVIATLSWFYSVLFYSILSHNLGRSLGHHRRICNNPFPICPVFSCPS